MSNLLKDLLPDEPREAGLLVAAAQADLAGSLRGYMAQGLDPGTAVSLTASSFVSSTSHTQEACTWVATELARALGLDPAAARFEQETAPPPQSGQRTLTGAVNAAFGQAPAPPPYAPTGPAAWQQPPPGLPGAAFPGRAASIIAALLGFGGALLVLIGCLVPYEKGFSSGQPSFGILTGHSGFPASFTFWIAAEPIGVMLVIIVIAIALLATSGRGRRLAGLLPGMLLAFGIQTTLLFAGTEFTVIPAANREAGGYIGLLGGLVLLAAGAVSLIGAGSGAQAPPGVSRG
jgi:hypothetical protein